MSPTTQKPHQQLSQQEYDGSSDTIDGATILPSTLSTGTLSPTHPCGKTIFAKLPLELRIQCFSPLLEWTGVMPPIILAMRGHKQEHDELVEIFHRDNVFVLKKENDWRVLPVASERFVQRIKIIVDSFTGRNAAGRQRHSPDIGNIGWTLQALPGLKEVHIEGHDYPYTHPKSYNYIVQLDPIFSGLFPGHEHPTGPYFVRNCAMQYLDLRILRTLKKIILTIPSLYITEEESRFRLDGLLEFHRTEFRKAIQAMNEAWGVEGKVATANDWKQVSVSDSNAAYRAWAMNTGLLRLWDTKEDVVWEAEDGKTLIETAESKSGHDRDRIGLEDESSSGGGCGMGAGSSRPRLA